MKKRALTQLLADADTESQEITALKSILNNRIVSALPDNDKLPIRVIEMLRSILSAAKNVAPKTSRILKALANMIFLEHRGNWRGAIDPLQKLSSASNMHLLALQIVIQKINDAELLDREENKVTSRTQSHHVSRRWFFAKIDENAWKHSLRHHVMYGEEEEVKALLDKCSGLLKEKMRFIGRDGCNMVCTAYQRARWEGDRNMWRILENYMTPEEIKDQSEELKTKGLGRDGMYGAQFNFQPLLDAYDALIEHTKRTNSPTGASEFKRLWKQLAALQIKLPIHLINQFFHPKPFVDNKNVPREFNDEILPRNTKYSNGVSIFNIVKGEDFNGVIRHNNKDVKTIFPSRLNFYRHDIINQIIQNLSGDRAAVKRLENVINQHYEHPFKQCPTAFVSTSSMSF